MWRRVAALGPVAAVASMKFWEIRIYTAQRHFKHMPNAKCSCRGRFHRQTTASEDERSLTLIRIEFESELVQWSGVSRVLSEVTSTENGNSNFRTGVLRLWRSGAKLHANDNFKISALKSVWIPNFMKIVLKFWHLTHMTDSGSSTNIASQIELSAHLS